MENKNKSQRMFEQFLNVFMDVCWTVLVRAAQLLSPLRSADSSPVSADIYRQRRVSRAWTLRLHSRHSALNMKEPRGLQPRLKRRRRGTEPPAAQQLISIFFFGWTALVFALSPFLLPFIFPLFNHIRKKRTCFNYRSTDLSPRTSG